MKCGRDLQGPVLASGRFLVLIFSVDNKPAYAFMFRGLKISRIDLPVCVAVASGFRQDTVLYKDAHQEVNSNVAGLG